MNTLLIELIKEANWLFMHLIDNPELKPGLNKDQVFRNRLSTWQTKVILLLDMIIANQDKQKKKDVVQ